MTPQVLSDSGSTRLRDAQLAGNPLGIPPLGAFPAPRTPELNRRKKNALGIEVLNKKAPRLSIQPEEIVTLSHIEVLTRNRRRGINSRFAAHDRRMARRRKTHGRNS
jgi:hypothetical protein